MQFPVARSHRLLRGLILIVAIGVFASRSLDRTHPQLRFEGGLLPEKLTSVRLLVIGPY